MTLEAPVAKDLRMLSAFMQLVRDLERIGDYAEDLAEIAIKLFPYPPHLCVPQIGYVSSCPGHAGSKLVALADLDAQAGQAVAAG